MHARPDAAGGTARPALLAVLAAAGMAAASAVAWRAAAVPTGEPRASASGAREVRAAAEDAPAASDAPPEGGGAASEAALRAYETGLSLWQRDPIQGAARFKRAATLDPRFAEAQYRLAVAGLFTGRAAESREAAQAALRDAGRLTPDHRAAAPALARYLDGAFDLTSHELEKALPEWPANADLHLLAGRLHLESCEHFDPAAAAGHLEPALLAHPDLADLRWMLADAYVLAGMHDWALSRALELAARHPDRPEATSETGRVRITRGEHADAMEAADDVIRAGGDVFASGLAPAFILTGEWDHLAAMYDPEMERTNTLEANALTHLHAGINAIWRGRLAEAVEHLERGPEFTPAPWRRARRALFYLLLGRTLDLQGRAREARAALDAGLHTLGEHPALEYTLGAVEVHAGDVTEARRALKRLGIESRTSQPGWTEPWRRLLAGEIALASGDPARGLDEIREAWRLQRPLVLDCVAGHVDGYFLDALGRAYLASRRPREALQAFEQLRALGIRGLHQPELGVLAVMRSGFALEALGRPQEARDNYERFLRLWGGPEGLGPDVREARRRLERLQGVGS